MKSETLTDYCLKSFNEREHCCFGISPFNSYFSEERIRELALWGLREFKSMHFFVPDIPAIYTLIAQGYTREKAEWKARRQSQYLKNKITNALGSVLMDKYSPSELILDWERLTSISRYNNLLNDVNDLFESDIHFREKCLQASKWVLTQKTSGKEDFTEEALHTAVKYFLAELPLFTDTPGIVGKTSSVFCYHQRVEFLENFYGRKLSYAPNDNQGFVVVQASENTLAIGYEEASL